MLRREGQRGIWPSKAPGEPIIIQGRGNLSGRGRGRAVFPAEEGRYFAVCSSEGEALSGWPFKCLGFPVFGCGQSGGRSKWPKKGNECTVGLWRRRPEPPSRRKGRGTCKGRGRTHQCRSLCCSCPGRRSDEHCRHHMAACTLQPGIAAAARDLVRTGMEDPDWVSATAAAAPCPEAAQPLLGLRHPRLLHVKQRRSRDAVGPALRQRFPLLPGHC